MGSAGHRQRRARARRPSDRGCREAAEEESRLCYGFWDRGRSRHGSGASHVGESDADAEQYLIEVENTLLKNVPASWTKISGTKKVSRFHTPEVVKLMRERDQHKEALAAACDTAFAALLVEMSSKYQGFRDCVQSLAVLDCLLSLADVASQPGYVRPEYMDRTGIVVEQGRHPMVEQILLDSYVPNDTALSADGTRALLVTGPNMGGKSSYVRQVALIAIMAQIGSYVPAARARLGLVDAVFTRMGAFDNMMAGESTFMVELSETSDMLKQATPRSLVILDELGRGTSTHDGVAIAQAVLDHVVRDLRCLTLFITHYQALSGMARAFDHGELRNVHMRFAEKGDDGREILFLYEVADGVAHRSYGWVYSLHLPCGTTMRTVQSPLLYTHRPTSSLFAFRLPSHSTSSCLSVHLSVPTDMLVLALVLSTQLAD